MLHCKINLLRIKEGHFTDIYELTPTSFIPSGTDLEFFYDFFQLANLKLDILEINSFLFVLLLAFSKFQIRCPITNRGTFLSAGEQPFKKSLGRV